jgi:methylornithine synthase
MVSSMNPPPDSQIRRIIEKTTRAEQLTRKEILILLGLKGKEQLHTLFQAARNLREQYFGNQVFLYGFLYTSTYCRNDCGFCYYRRSNSNSLRYRKTEEDIIEASVLLAETGVHLIDLTMGEDPLYYSDSQRGFDSFVRIISAIKRETGLPVMVSPGRVPLPIIQEFKKAGVAWYACYQETHNRHLFKKLRPGQSYKNRLEAKIQAHKMGVLIEEGLLCGVGESMEDVADSIKVMQELDADQVRVMRFVPRKGTPMENIEPSSPLWEMKIIACLRIIFPDRLIPATLDVDGLGGLAQRLKAGANVVTSLVPPGQGLAGVAQSTLDIDEARRTSSSVSEVLERVGLKSATIREYQSWIQNRQLQIKERMKGGELCE